MSSPAQGFTVVAGGNSTASQGLVTSITAHCLCVLSPSSRNVSDLHPQGRPHGRSLRNATDQTPVEGVGPAACGSVAFTPNVKAYGQACCLDLAT